MARAAALEGLCLGALVLLACLGCIFLLAREAKTAFTGEVHEDLQRLAQAISTTVDVPLHDSIRDPSQQGSPDFERAVAPLRHALHACEGVKYVYTGILRGDGVHFILDSANPGDADGDGRDDQAKVMELYKDADPAMVAALREGRSTTSAAPYADEWGTFLSGFAPFRGGDGRVAGVVGVDISLEAYNARLSAIDRAAAIGCIPAVLIALITGIAGFLRSRSTRLSYRAMSEARQVVEAKASELLAAQRTLDQRNETLERYVTQISSANTALEERQRQLDLQNRELTALYDEGVKKSRQLEIARQAADAANQAKSDFLANMSHEIRTPMTAILGCTELLSEMIDGPEAEDLSRTIHRNGEHLLEIINDILDLSKIEAGRLDLDHRPFSPANLLEEVVALLRVRADARKLSLDVRPLSRLPSQVMSDPTRVKQVLLNLVGNAIKFTERGGVTVNVTCDDSGGRPRLQFDVVDTGIGMSSEQVGALFRPFTQADSSMSRRFGGTGLGLAISKRIAAMLGGDVEVVSTRPGAGSVIRFSFVASEASVADTLGTDMHAEVAPEPVPAAPTGAAEGALTGMKVLVAEDVVDNQRLIAFILRRAGAEVSIAENGKLAHDEVIRALAAGQPYDAVVMDMQMPVMDGYAATRRLREAGCATPIIALTAHAMTGDREKCLAAGCDDFTTKPVDRDLLVATIAHHVARERQSVTK